MCLNKKCPRFGRCYRAMATPKFKNQSYMDFKFDDEGNCPDFLYMYDRAVKK